MSEYYAEHESIEEVASKFGNDSSELDNSSAEIAVSAKTIASSQTLDSLGYSNLTSRTQTSVTKLSGKVKQISGILDTVAALYADYEGRVIAALDDSVSQGNNFTSESRGEIRYATDDYILIIEAKGEKSKYIYTPGSDTHTTSEEKRFWLFDWIANNHPIIIKKIEDAFTDGGIMLFGSGLVAMTDYTSSRATGVNDSGFQYGSLTGEGDYQSPSDNNVIDQTNQGAGDNQTENQIANKTDDAKDVQTDAKSDVASGIAGTEANAFDAGGDVSGATATPDFGGSDSGYSVAGSGGDAGVGGGSSVDGGSGWVPDMLNDAVDTSAAQQAQNAVQSIASTPNPEATRSGAATLSDSSSMGFVADGQSGFAAFWANVGNEFVAVVQRYGLNAGILAGGAGVAYASSGVAVEAVAHCAEFMATKCMPGINGFMEQAAGVARVTQVSIRAVISNVARGVGGLIG